MAFANSLMSSKRKPGLVGFAVKNLQGRDLVLVVPDELFEGLDNTFSSLQGIGAESGFNDLILAHVINGLLDFLVEFNQQVPQVRII